MISRFYFFKNKKNQSIIQLFKTSHAAQKSLRLFGAYSILNQLTNLSISPMFDTQNIEILCSQGKAPKKSKGKKENKQDEPQYNDFDQEYEELLAEEEEELKKQKKQSKAKDKKEPMTQEEYEEQQKRLEQRFKNSIEKTIITINGPQNWYNQVLKNKIPSVIYFHSRYCYSCKEAYPMVKNRYFEDFDKENQKYSLFRIDIDEEEKICSSNDIDVAPTTAVVVNGKIVDKIIGLFQKEQFEDFLDKALLKTEALPNTQTIEDWET